MANEEQQLKERQGDGEFVPTEAEKDAKRKRETRVSPTSPPRSVAAKKGLVPPASQRHLGSSQFLDEEEDYSSSPPEHGIGFIDDEADSDPVEAEVLDLTDDQPDLHQYFSRYPDVSDDNVISMCRAYASYLVSLRPKKQPAGRPSKYRK